MAYVNAMKMVIVYQDVLLTISVRAEKVVMKGNVEQVVRLWIPVDVQMESYVLLMQCAYLVAERVKIVQKIKNVEADNV